MAERPAGPTGAQLTNPRSERVKKVAALAGRSARDRAGKVLVEGPQAVREALAFAAHRVSDVFVTEELAARHPELLAQDCGPHVFVHLVTPDVAKAMSENSQGVVAVLAAEAASIDSLPLALERSPRALVCVLFEARDPGNVGTVIRVADAAGAAAVILAGDSVDPDNPKVIRASVGSVFHLPVMRVSTLHEAADAVRAAGMRLWAADGSGDLILGQGEAAVGALEVPTAWLFGNEAHGLGPAELAMADAVVRIPMLGGTESLNLASAATLCLYGGLWSRNPA